MPDRIIRDELLRSTRYRTLTSDTSWLLLFHLLLSVDNLGNHEADSFAIGDVLRRTVDEATAAKMLNELADVDLIRLYQIDSKPYLHIPRFRQRLRYIGAKHPRPPNEIECNEIRALCKKVGIEPGFIPTKARRAALEVKRSEEKRSEEKRSRSKPAHAPEAVDNSTTNTAATPQVKTVLEKLASQPRPANQRSKDEQLAYVAAMKAKGARYWKRPT